MTLSDKANLFNSSDKWKLTKIEGTLGGYTIKNITSKRLLEAQEDMVIQENLVHNKKNNAQIWEQRFPKNGKYFTLANLDNKKLLTATSDDQLAIKGNDTLVHCSKIQMNGKKTEPVPIQLPRASRNCQNKKHFFL